MKSKATKPKIVNGIAVPAELALYPIDQVRVAPNNPRVHPVDEVDALVTLIREVGFLVPVLLDRGRIVAGHARVEAARRLGMKKVPFVNGTHLSEKQRRLFMVADNKIPTMASWSAKNLAGLLAEIATDYGSTAVAGFSDEEMRRVSDDLARIKLGEVATPPAAAGGDEPDRPAEPRPSDDDEDELVPFQVLISPDDREAVYAAIRKVKARDGVSNSGVALLTIIREWKP